MRKLAVATVLLFGLMGCSSASSTGTSPSPVVTSPSTTATQPVVAKVDYSKQYLGITKPYNTLEASFKVHPATTTAAKLQDLKELSKALVVVDGKLAKTQWPSKASADVKSLIRANANLARDFSDVFAVSQGQYNKDTATVKADTNTVRNDLGLNGGKDD